MLPSAPRTATYRVGPGDQLDINVLGADELKGRSSVRDDGAIKYAADWQAHCRQDAKDIPGSVSRRPLTRVVHLVVVPQNDDLAGRVWIE